MFPVVAGAAAVCRLTRSGSPPDGLTASERADGFGSSVRSTGSAVLLAVRGDDGSVGQFVLSSGRRDPARVAGNVASAVAAKVTRLDSVQAREALSAVTGSRRLVQLVARPGRSAVRETQAGGDPTMLAEYLGGGLSPGSWVAVSLRAPSRREVEASRRWFAFRLDGATTHYSRRGSTLVGTFWAGGDDAAASSVLAGLAALMPGFDVECRPVRAARVRAAVIAWCAAAVLLPVLADGFPFGLLPAWRGVAPWVGRLAGAVAGDPAAGVSWTVPASTARLLWAVSAGVFGLALLVGLGVVPTVSSWRSGRVLAGRFPPPPRRWWPVRAPRARSVTAAGRAVRERRGDYPLARSVFPGVAGDGGGGGQPAHRSCRFDVDGAAAVPAGAVGADRAGGRVPR